MKKLSEMSMEELWELFPIILREHNPAYGEWYEEQRRELTALLRDYTITRVSHIGSTSVEGLIAKPTVDILLELAAGYDVDQLVGILESADWILMIRDDDRGYLELNKGYTPSGFANKVYHLHVKRPGDWDELYFRDYLRAHPKTAREYGALKLSLKERYEHNRDAYTDAKTEFVRRITQLGRQEFAGRYKA